MAVSISEGPAIMAGYQYRLQIETDVASFPAGCALAAQVRAKISDTAAIATLTTANGGLLRVSDTVVEIVIAPEASAHLRPGSIVMDMVRTDLEPDRHLAFTLEIPVVLPVTRGL